MIEILENRGLLSILGPDAGNFLQSMTTNNVLRNIYSYNYILNNQGRYLFDFFVYRQNSESYFIDIDQDSLENLVRLLTMYKLRRNLDIKNISNEYNILYSKLPVESDVEFSLQDPRCKKLGYRSMIKKEKINNFNTTKDSLYLLDKYDYAIIDGNIDLIYDKSIPIEYGAEELNAISYDKGCYVGQEVISRAKYQGVVRKNIFKLQFNKEITNVKQGDSVIDSENNKIGIICSIYRNQSIALLRKEKVSSLKEQIAIIENEVANIETPAWRS